MSDYTHSAHFLMTFRPGESNSGATSDTDPAPRLTIMLVADGVTNTTTGTGTGDGLSQTLEVGFSAYQGPVLVVVGDKSGPWLRLLRRDTWELLPDIEQPSSVNTWPALAPDDAVLAYAYERPYVTDEALLCDPRTRTTLPGLQLPSDPLDLLWIDDTQLLARCSGDRLYVIDLGEAEHSRTQLYPPAASCDSLPGTMCVAAAS